MDPTKPDQPHYNNLKMQPIEFMEQTMTPKEFKGFLLGNAMKYLLRHEHKGQKVEDLEKAKVYTEWLWIFEKQGYLFIKPKWMADVQELYDDTHPFIYDGEKMVPF